MRRRYSGSMLLLVMLCSLCLAASDVAAEMVKLKGSGASFPFNWLQVLKIALTS
jgi:hypothetical protein